MHISNKFLMSIIIKVSIFKLWFSPNQQIRITSLPCRDCTLTNSIMCSGIPIMSLFHPSYHLHRKMCAQPRCVYRQSVVHTSTEFTRSNRGTVCRIKCALNRGVYRQSAVHTSTRNGVPYHIRPLLKDYACAIT